MEIYSKKYIVIGGFVVGIVALAFGGNYVYNCAQTNSLFFNADKTAWYHYDLNDRIGFCFNMLFQPDSPKAPDRSVEVAVMGSMSKFQVEPERLHPPYSSDPPASGWNYNIGVGTKYTKNDPFSTNAQMSVPSEVAVARLYRGRVWITFSRGGEVTEAHIAEWQAQGISEEEIENRKKLAHEKTATPPEIVEKLKKIAASSPLVFVSSRRVLDSDIALTALGRQDKFNLENGKLTDEQISRIWDFILRYRNQSI